MSLLPDLAPQRAQVVESICAYMSPHPLRIPKMGSREGGEYDWSLFSISKELESEIYGLVAVTGEQHSLMKSKLVLDRHCVPVPISFLLWG